MRRNVIIAFCLAGCLLSVMGGASAQNVTAGKNVTDTPTAMNMTSPTMANTTDSDTPMLMNMTTRTNTTSAKNATKAGNTTTTTKAGNATCMSVSEYLDASSNTTVGPELAKLVKAGFNGTVFVPTDKALNAVLDSILEAASKIANKTISTLPAGVDLFALAELQDVLKLHIVPDVAIDPTVLKASNFADSNPLELTFNKTLLSSVAKQSLCPNTTKAPLDVIVAATLTPAYKLGKVTISSAGGNASVVNATVGNLCDGVVHIIDAVLLPCNTNQSVIPALARTLAAAANSTLVPSVNIPTNGTRGVSLNGTNTTAKGSSAGPAVGMNIGTMLAAMCAVMIMSGTTSYTLIAALTVIVGGVLTVATM